MLKNRVTGGGDSASPARLGLLTALSLAGALTYVFVLLVPTWRTIYVDRALIGEYLTNQSGNASDSSQQWDALSRDPLLHSRSANAFRECLTAEDGFNASVAWDTSLADKSNSPTEKHLLESLAGVTNATLLTGDRTSRHRANVGSDRCWFLNMHWSMDDSHWDLMTTGHRALLRYTRALFLLAVCLLLCYCVCLTCSLYACFATRLATPCCLLLLTAHGLSLSQLIALAILQDVSVRLAVARLDELLAAAGFPTGCTAAVTGARGLCSLTLFCLLCLASAVQMLLLVVPAACGAVQERHKSRRRQDNPTTGGASAGGDRQDGEKAARECDDTEDTNPLI